MGAACAVGKAGQGARKKTNRANLNCAPCGVDTRLGRPAYHGRLSPAMRENQSSRPGEHESSPSLSRLIPTASSTPAWARAWGAPARRHLVPAPRSSGPSHTVRVGRADQTEQNRTKCGSPPRPICPGQSRGRLGELWPMTSRTQLPIEVHPNQTGRGTPAPQPEPARPLPVTRLGHQHALPAPILLPLCSHPAQGRPQTTQSRSQPGAGQVHGKLPLLRYPDRFLSMWLLRDSTSWEPSVTAICPQFPIPQSHSSPAQPRSGPVWSLFFFPLLSLDGLDGLMRDFFPLARFSYSRCRPLPTSAATVPGYSRTSCAAACPRPRHHFAR